MIAASDQSKERKAADAKARAPEGTTARAADAFATATAPLRRIRGHPTEGPPDLDA